MARGSYALEDADEVMIETEKRGAFGEQPHACEGGGRLCGYISIPAATTDRLTTNRC